MQVNKSEVARYMLKQVIVNKKCGTITAAMCSISDNKSGEAVFIIKDEIGYIKSMKM